jgi:hypothetical protein
MINLSYTICFILFTSGVLNTPERYLTAERFNVCQEVATAAIDLNISPVIATSMAWEESRFGKNTISRTGCCYGPLQINPRYYCPGKSLENCDLVQDGVAAIKRNYLLYSNKNISEPFPTLRVSHREEWEDVLCHYNAGNVCTERSENYASRIIRLSDRISVMLARHVRLNQNICI